MTVLHIVATAVSCLFIGQPLDACLPQTTETAPAVAGVQSAAPEFTGGSVDVELTAEAVLVWDMASGAVLYEKRPNVQRPVASLSKLLSTLTVRAELAPTELVVIPTEAARVQRLGAHIKLPIGEHATVQELLEASLIASANDAMVSLAVATGESEDKFVQLANQHAKTIGATHTQIANSTGLTGGTQFSTAEDIRLLLEAAYADTTLRPFLSQRTGVLTTAEGSRRAYKTTNDLLGTYLPIHAAKTGYTIEAGENLAIITAGSGGQEIGVVVLGSRQRFQDTKVVTEWIWRNYTW